jgi:hypothetical protein
VGGGCVAANGMTVLGAGWGLSSDEALVAAQLGGAVDAAFACPNAGRPAATAVALSRTLSLPAAHRLSMLEGCGVHVATVHASAKAPPPPPDEQPLMERLVVNARVVSTNAGDTLDAKLKDAVERCYPPGKWPKQRLRGWLAVNDTGTKAPEAWQLLSAVDDERGDRCVRGWAAATAKELRRSGKGPGRFLADYDLAPGKLALALSVEGVEGNAWAPPGVEEKLDELVDCYEPVLKRTPSAFGPLAVRAIIDGRKRILSVRSKQDPALNLAAYCAAPKLQGVDAKPPASIEDPTYADFLIEMVWKPR